MATDHDQPARRAEGAETIPEAVGARPRIRVAQKHHPGDAPPWSRAKMIETGMTLFVVLALVAFGLFTMFPLDIAARKEQQRLDRAGKYMMMAEETIEASKRLQGAYFAPTAEGALPEAEFVDLFAGQRQNRPLYREEGRIARLDMYGPSGAYRDPLKYALAGERWLLWSLGPDERPDIPATILAEEADATRLQERLLQSSYDPTNGVGSAGDLWLSNINRS